MEVPGPGHLDGDGIFWATTFTVGVFAAAAACIWRGFVEARRSSPKRRPWIDGAFYVLNFLLIVGAFYLLESWAHHRTPFFLYPAQFPLMLPPLDFSRFAIHPTACSNLVKSIEGEIGAAGFRSGVPVAIIVMEASLFCSVMWIGRFFKISAWRLPFFVALVLVNVDLLLDPIVTRTYSCEGTLVSSGLGLWQWFVATDSARSGSWAGSWFGVPLFNYATWWGGPLFLSVVVMAVGWGKDWLKHVFALGTGAVHRRVSAAPDLSLATVERWEGEWKRHVPYKPLLLLAGLGGAGVVVWFSPNFAPADPLVQWLLLTYVVLGSAAYFIPRAYGFFSEVQIDWQFAFPQLFTLVFPAALLIGAGLFSKSWILVLLSVLIPLVGFLFCWGTQQAAVHRFAESLRGLDGFLRIHYYALSAMLLLLTAATVASDFTGLRTRVLLGIAACFHVFGYLLNDVMDADEDRRTNTRANHWIPTGRVRRGYALALAVSMVPAAAGITLLANAGVAEYVVLGAAFALISVYDVFGKRLPTPLWADAIKGGAWGCLALFPAYLVGEGPARLTWLVVFYGAGFVFLMNVVRRRGREAQPLALVLVALLGSSLFFEPFASTYDDAARGVIAFGLLNLWIWTAVNLHRLPEPRYLDGGPTQHLLPLLVAPLWIFGGYLEPDFRKVVLMGMVLPLLARADIVSMVLGPYEEDRANRPLPSH